MPKPLKVDDSTTPTKLVEMGIGGSDEPLDNVTIDYSKVTSLAEFIRDTIGTALVAGTNMTVTVNDGADTITLASTGGGGGNDLAVTALGSINSGTTLTIDGSKAYTATLAANIAFTWTLSGLDSSKIYIVRLILTQDGTGSRAISHAGTNVKPPGAVVPTLAASANAVSILTYLVHNSSVYLHNLTVDHRNS